MEGCTEQKNPAWKALQARSQCPRKVTYCARTPLRPYVRRATEGIHCDRRLSPPTPSPASPGLASLSTHPGAHAGDKLIQRKNARVGRRLTLQPRYASWPSRRDAQNAPQGSGRLLRMRAQCTCKGRGWFLGAQRNLALSISESPHHSKSILPYCQPIPQPSECTPAPANRSGEYRL